MLYVQLDTNWPDNPKIIRAGWEAAGVHAAVMCLAKRLEKDGWVDRVLLHRMSVRDEVIDRLIELDLLEASGDLVRPHDWLDRNPSQSAIDARRASKIAAGKRGNHDRWQHPWPFEDCPKCNPKEQVVAGSDPTLEGCDPTAIAEHRTPTKSTYEVATAIAPGIDLERHPPPRIDEDTRQLALASIHALKNNPAKNGETVTVQVSGALTNREGT